MTMTPERYRKIYQWFNDRPAAKKLLLRLAELLPAVPFVLYPALLVLWGSRMVRQALAGDLAGAYLCMTEQARAILVPFVVFAGGTAVRRRLNRPRPYEQEGFVPLLEKKARGNSFPSRHVLSAAVIAATWWRTNAAVGAALSAVTVLLAVLRVLVGVHHPKDVLCGAALGFGLGALGMLL